ncbi:putative disease resistance protein [Platanthera guangdongensis]|uniref:Disease resistance protein n=1 Tax=Platanthera guangdongensis TaxID=2320717 RepID=A0ABR2M7F1_9ASPA
MAEVVATSFLSLVSNQLASKSLSEFALLTGAEEELRKLERTLSTIQHVLENTETKQVKDRALRSWLKKLKDLAYDADDVLDEFATKAMKLKPGIEAGMKEKMDLQQIGQQYVDDLHERSLFQKNMCIFHFITMHDLVHDLVRSVASDECSIVDPSSSNKTLPQNSRYPSFIFNKKPISVALQSLHDAKKLRTLYLETDIFTIGNNEVLHVISSNVNLLIALHLKNYPLKTLPDSFKKLKHLRGCKCEKLPALGHLPQLEYLKHVGLPLIKQLGSDFYGGPNSFPVLKELKLYDMPELEEWCNVGEEQFLPCLHKLSLVP